MKKILLTLALVAASCGSLGTSTSYQRGNIISAVEIVVQRHDTYVGADTSLSEVERASYLAQSAEVIAVTDVDPIPKVALDKALPPVLDRTDAYVLADTSLTAPKQVQRMRTSALLRRLIQPNE